MAPICPRCGEPRGPGTTRCWKPGCNDITPLDRCPDPEEQFEPAASGPADEFEEVLFGPFGACLERYSRSTERRATLDAVSPDALRTALRQGASAAARTYAGVLSGETLAAIDRLVGIVAREASGAHAQIWEELDHYERYGTWEGLAEGLFSDETALGASIGGLILPGVGHVLGGMVGGWFAGNRIDSQAQERARQLDASLQHVAETAAFTYRNTVQALVAADLSAPAARRRRLWPWILVVLLLGGAVLAWAYLSKQGDGPGADAPAVAPVPPADPLAGLTGIWETSTGERFEARRAGDRIEFRTVAEGNGFAEGEVRFATYATTDPAVFEVEDRARLAPAGRSPTASRAVIEGSCTAIVDAVGGRPLRARLVDGALTVALAGIPKQPGFWTVQNGRVVSCDMERALAASRRVEQVLRRVARVER